MATRIAAAFAAALVPISLALSPQATRADSLSPSTSENGIVKVRSAYPVAETIDRLKRDVASKGIMFFFAVDQSTLAADAGIRLRPSTLLVFGNPALGSQFMTSNPFSGIDWPVRLPRRGGRERGRVGRVQRLRLHRAPPRHHRSRGGLREGVRGHRLRSRRALAISASCGQVDPVFRAGRCAVWHGSASP